MNKRIRQKHRTQRNRREAPAWYREEPNEKEIAQAFAKYPGEWSHEPGKVQWLDIRTGLPCLAVRAPVTGAWCGYAGVRQGHRWFGLGYRHTLRTLENGYMVLPRGGSAAGFHAWPGVHMTEDMMAFWKPPKGNVLAVQFVIYDHPRDAPNCYVIRRWEVLSAGTIRKREAHVFERIEDARAILPPWATCIGRFPEDDPCILETWV